MEPGTLISKHGCSYFVANLLISIVFFERVAICVGIREGGTGMVVGPFFLCFDMQDCCVVNLNDFI